MSEEAGQNGTVELDSSIQPESVLQVLRDGEAEVLGGVIRSLQQLSDTNYMLISLIIAAAGVPVDRTRGVFMEITQTPFSREEVGDYIEQVRAVFEAARK